MRVIGRVVGGKVELEEALPEGAEVVVYLDEEVDEDFELTPELRQALREAAAEADRGQVVDADVVLAEIAALR
jgi:hypothetical protein